jgi:hypothetical protein
MTNILAIDENSMSVQYPGCRAAILGAIHRHRSHTSFNFTPEIYSRIESQKRLLPVFVCDTQIQIKRARAHTMVPDRPEKASRSYDSCACS